uniref:ATP-grasp domain-containing protein n=1 Tax=Biomphalaria glabrata TaxID=6526 RepID=A0A2C9LJT8_BIOGL
MGGDSPERSVSINGAENVRDSLVRLGHDVLMVDARPIANGSSIDVKIVNKVEDFYDFSGEWIVEEYIHGRELTTGVLGDRYLCPLEIVYQKTDEPYIIDSSSKYVAGEVIHKIPEGLPDHVMEKMKYYALGAHKACFCDVLSRADMRYDPITEELFVLELNTHPGLTKTSLFPDIAKNSGISFDELISEIISLSMKKSQSSLLVSDPLYNLSVSNDGSSCLSFKKTSTNSSDVVVDFSGMNDWDNKVFIA